MPEEFTFTATESTKTYARTQGSWVHMFRDKTDVNGRKSTTLGAELHKDRVPEFIEWLQDFLQE